MPIVFRRYSVSPAHCESAPPSPNSPPSPATNIQPPIPAPPPKPPRTQRSTRPRCLLRPHIAPTTSRPALLSKSPSPVHPPYRTRRVYTSQAFLYPPPNQTFAPCSRDRFQIAGFGFDKTRKHNDIPALSVSTLYSRPALAVHSYRQQLLYNHIHTRSAPATTLESHPYAKHGEGSPHPSHPQLDIPSNHIYPPSLTFLPEPT